MGLGPVPPSMRSCVAVAFVVAAVALAGCIGAPSDASSSSDDADPGNTSVVETEERTFVDESFSLAGQDASSSWDVTVPDGTTNVSIRVEVQTQAASGFAIDGFEDCSTSATVNVVVKSPVANVLVGSDLHEVDCDDPTPGDHTVTVSHDGGVSEGTIEVAGEIPVGSS